MEKTKTIFLTPHSHYDVVWAFNKEDYYQINEIILTKAIKMMEKGDFKFLVEQTYLLEMIEERNPGLFASVKEAILSDRIELVDAQYIMADPMMPMGEILVREILRGKKYCKEKFGKDVYVAWAADGFGLNAQMPQIYKKSGYRWLAFRRGLPRAVGHRVSEFIWVGLDGSRILSHWLPLGYRAGLELDKWEQNYDILAVFATTDNVLMPCGSGGVPPQEDTVEKLAQWNSEHDNIKMVMATPGQFFKKLEDDVQDLAEYQGELYSQDLENVFPDVVSSRIRLKMGYKQSENILITAEKLATMARIKFGHYPAELMSALWDEMLFLGNHDVFSCCGIDEIYGEAWDYINHIKEAADNVIKNSLERLLPPGDKGNCITVINPNNWEVTDWVEVEVKLPPEISKQVGVSFKGNEIPSQILEIEGNRENAGNRVRLGFIATVPPMGYRVYDMIESSYEYQVNGGVEANEVENSFYRMEVDDKTGIIRVFDKYNGRKILEGNELVVDQEIGDLYFHKSQLNTPIDTESGEGIQFSAFMPEGFVVEKGPVRTAITYKSAFYCLQWPYYLTEKFGSILQRHRTIEVCKEVFIYNDIPRIDFKTTIDSSQSHIRIRVKFDSCMVVPEYTRQTQFGAINLPSAKTIEQSVCFPSLNWFNCQEGHRGLAFFSRGVPINEVFAGNIYCTLLRSVSVLSADGKSGPLIPTPDAMELGNHVYHYAVYPHSGDWKRDNVYQKGHSFNHCLIALQTGGAAPYKEFSILKLEPDNLIISALKPAENGSDVILRFFETHGKPCRAVLQLPQEIKAVESVNLIEGEGVELNITDNCSVELNVSPFEIVTLKLRLE
ncbi:MAG: glycoside hydrolase [Dehalococcoidia bacterium]|nr:glycoside hydrolase [Dehalococcoidia bacterium]